MKSLGIKSVPHTVPRRAIEGHGEVISLIACERFGTEDTKGLEGFEVHAFGPVMTASGIWDIQGCFLGSVRGY